MSKLQTLQSFLTNDLTVFRGRYFEDMEIISGEPEAGEVPRESYRVPSLDRFETWFIGGIVGGRKPSTYSESPRLWNTYFERSGIKGVFFGLDLPHEKDFPGFLGTFSEVPGALDLTVTDPYKNAAFHAVKESSSAALSEQAEGTEMVNHIIMDGANRKTLALNTDGLGMIRALREEMDISGRTVLMFGAGGSAGSIGYELVKAGNDLHILNRTPERAKNLVQMLEPLKHPNRQLQWGGFEKLQSRLPQADIVINALPEGCPVTSDHTGLLKQGVLLAETTYGHKSALKGPAGGAGVHYVDGTAMLFGQFVEAVAHVFPILGISSEEHKRVMDSLSL
jgi:shikimate dehydrogenase